MACCVLIAAACGLLLSALRVLSRVARRPNADPLRWQPARQRRNVQGWL